MMSDAMLSAAAGSRSNQVAASGEKMKRRIAVVGTGGSIATLGRSPFDLIDYGRFGRLLPIEQLLGLFPDLNGLADLVPVAFDTIHSEAISPADWVALAKQVMDLQSGDLRVDGTVVVHGTSTLEESAWFLDLTVKIERPLVIVGAQRPPNAMGTDAAINLANGIRAASARPVAALGVVAVFNNEIHAARDVTKASTYALDAFRSDAFGPLGVVDADGSVAIYRNPARRLPSFSLAGLKGELPRVDVAFAYAGADGVDIDAFTAAGSRAIVLAAMAPGTCSPGQLAALERASRQGVVIAFSTRAGCGRVLNHTMLQERGFIAADNLTPQKARILLMLAIASGLSPEQMAEQFLLR